MNHSFKSKKVIKKNKRRNKEKFLKLLNRKSNKRLRILKNIKFLFYQSSFKNKKKTKKFVLKKYKKFIKAFYRHSAVQKSSSLTNHKSYINLLVREREEGPKDTSSILDKKFKTNLLSSKSKNDKLTDDFSLELKQISGNFVSFLLARDYAKFSKQNLFLPQINKFKVNPLKTVDSLSGLKDFMDTLKKINKLYIDIKEQKKIFSRNKLSKKYTYKSDMSRQSLRSDLKRLDFDSKFSWFPYHFVFNLRLSPNNIFCHLTDNDGMTVFPVRNGAYYNLKTSKWTVRNNLVSVFNAYWDEVILAYREGKMQQLFPNHIVFKINGIKRHRKDVLAYIKNDCIPKLRTFMTTYKHVPYVKTKKAVFEDETLEDNESENNNIENINPKELNISTQTSLPLEDSLENIQHSNNSINDQINNNDISNDEEYEPETAVQAYYKSLEEFDISKVNLEDWPINRSLNFTIEILNGKPFNGCRVKKEKRVRRFKSKFIKVRRG